ncbi:MAG: MBL fold metallo-hydrolase [Peptococcaceae bacterium]|nr:MBL fold metallo-hydrolase [Peptococcaceae bacterium]
MVPNIFLVKLPLPFGPDYVNCYLLKGKNGWSIIDTGINCPTSTAVWEKKFKDLGLKYSDIEGIYLTHLHPNHYGASGWLQALTGAPVYMNRTESISVEQIWKKERTIIPVVGELFKENGMPPSLIADVLDSMAEVWKITQPHPTISFLSDGEMLELGGRLFEVIHTPGHSDGHISFFNKDEGILISGDHLLPKASSNISLWPTSHPNPIGLFMNSLVKTGNMPVKLVLPAHGPCFANCSERVAELLDHHRIRLARIEEMTGNGTNAYQICVKLFGTDLSLHEIRFTLMETLAYLAYLESRSKVASRQEDGIVMYRKIG